MRKIVLAVAVVGLLGACLPFSQITNPTPNVDVAATSAANVMTSVALTLTAQPTFTSAPTTETSAELFATPQSPAGDTPASATATLVETPITATFIVATSTDLPATLPVGPATVTLTPGVLTYGTLPPAVPFSRLTLLNKSKRQVYISLQVVTAEGGPTIIEYPVRRQVELKAPIGSYLYVAWVGGRKMVGEFRLHKDEDLVIIIYSDKIIVR